MKRLLIDFSTSLIRTALTEDSILKELILEDKKNVSIVSNIYVGVVKNILPSQFAFLDIGQDRNAFLQLNDKKEVALYNKDKKNKRKVNVKNGQLIPVQVLKDPTKNKGACVTSQLTFTDKKLVLISNSSGKNIGVSRKISDVKERKRLKSIAMKVLPKNYGLIMRTECEGKTEEDIEKELCGLIETAKKTFERGKYVKGGCPVRKENYIAARAIRELFSEDIDEVIINSEEEMNDIKEIINSISKDFNEKVFLHKEDTLLFNHYGIEPIIEKLLNKKVWLKSGGFLIIEETEACVVIDVNTGKFEGKKNHSESILKINLEATIEICNQIKLRNLSGMIIIDFIDMRRQEYVDRLQKLLSEELKKDRISTNIVGMTKIGLMQLTRKKTREPISRILQRKCPTCNGAGVVLSPEHIVDKIHKAFDNVLSKGYYNKILLKTTSEINNLLKNHYSIINDIEKKYNAKIVLETVEKTKANYFDIEMEKVNND